MEGKHLILKGNFRSKKAEKSYKRLVARLDPWSPITEQYRAIRANILLSSKDNNIRTLLITSSGKGEGKTTTASNLAVVIAQQGKKVLLIDTDMRKPSLHHYFRKKNISGLSTILTKRDTLENVVHTDEIKNLFILTSGPISPNPSDLLASKEMEELMEVALKTYDLIIFDSPPLLVVSDAHVIANKCDGSLIVVADGKTDKDEFLKTKDLLEVINANILGVVFNNKKQKKRKNNDYYYRT